MKKNSAAMPNKSSVFPSKLNEKDFKTLIRAAVALNVSSPLSRPPKGRL